MNKQQFKKYIELHGPVKRRDYEMYIKLMRMHEDKPLKVTGKWLDYRAEWVKKGISQNPVFGKELTYSNCLSWEATYRNGNIIVTLTVHDKKEYGYGISYPDRCEFTVTGVPAKLFVTYIKEDLEDEAIRMEEEEELARRRKRRTQILNQLKEQVGLGSVCKETS